MTSRISPYMSPFDLNGIKLDRGEQTLLNLLKWKGRKQNCFKFQMEAQFFLFDCQSYDENNTNRGSYKSFILVEISVISIAELK